MSVLKEKQKFQFCFKDFGQRELLGCWSEATAIQWNTRSVCFKDFGQRDTLG
jgi:hypothetical protein